MKGLFPQYEELSSNDYSVVWKNALFVFDTNVLLNLYRYQSNTRDELLNVLHQLVGRVWIPHHVALEFQRNRLKVIAEQNKRFADVRRTIETAEKGLVADLDKLQLQKRHSLIDPQKLIAGFKKLTNDFLTELEQLQKTQQKLSAPDPLKQKIEEIFDERVGMPPKGQAAIDELYKEADSRYKLKIPPGYLDDDKDKDEPDEYIHGGIVYKRKYGDFLVWRQLLEHAKSSNCKSIIFVTDDSKEDWWRKIDSDGPKTIGPRPELIDEARVKGLVETLLMYSPESFLKYAKEFLKAQVSDETLKEVRDISTTKSLRKGGVEEFQERNKQIEYAVQEWLEQQFDFVKRNLGYPDFVVQVDGRTIGFEVKAVRNPRAMARGVRESVFRACFELQQGSYSEITIIWVVSDADDIEETRQILTWGAQIAIPENLQMLVGIFEDPNAGGRGLVLLEGIA